MGIYLQADWAAKEGTDKDFIVAVGNITFGIGGGTGYKVPEGKTLFLTHFLFSIWADASADGDKNQMGIAYIKDHDSGFVIAQIGGNGGASVVFNKPLIFAEDETMDYYIMSFANHTTNGKISAHGFEVSS
ncbi:hypothetical protein ES708_35012 [subsurface metagenome]